MKVLVVLAIVITVAWLLRFARRQSTDNPEDKYPEVVKSPVLHHMHPCAHCGIHLPSQEMAVGAYGNFYCSREHLLQSEGH